jgi:hypothetical protein
MIAMPVALGFSYAEIAAQAGLSHAEVVQRMRNLRGELEAQVAARRATEPCEPSSSNRARTRCETRFGPRGPL